MSIIIYYKMEITNYNKFTPYSVVNYHFTSKRSLQGTACKRFMDCTYPEKCCRDTGYCMLDMNNCVKVKDVHETIIKEKGKLDLTCSEEKLCSDPLKCCNGSCIANTFTCKSQNVTSGETCQNSTENVEWNMCEEGLKCIENVCASEEAIQKKIE